MEMGDEGGVFSDEDLEVAHPPPANQERGEGGSFGRKLKVLIPKLPQLGRVQQSGESRRETRSRSRSSTPTPDHLHLNGNGNATSTPSTNYNNGNSSYTHNNLNNGNNGNGSSGLYSLVVPAQPPRTPTPPTPHWSDGMSQLVLAGTIGLILVLLYSLVGLSSALAHFQSEFRETMNNYQMHLINIQTMHRLETKEGKEREKRAIGRDGKLEVLLMEVARALRPNLILGVTHPSTTTTVEYSKSKSDKKEGLVHLLEEIQFESPNQPRETFVQLLSVVGDTIGMGGKDSGRPAGVIILIPPALQSSLFPSCFARKLAKGINGIFGWGSHEVTPLELTLTHLLDTPDLATINAELKSYFTYQGGKSVFVHNLEEIQSYEMLMLLHTFSDNIMAYEREATFIFTVRVPPEVYGKYNWVDENGYRMTYETLSKAWSTILTPDKTPALIARIALANILLREGDTCHN